MLLAGPKGLATFITLYLDVDIAEWPLIVFELEKVEFAKLTSPMLITLPADPPPMGVLGSSKVMMAALAEPAPPAHTKTTNLSNLPIMFTIV